MNRPNYEKHRFLNGNYSLLPVLFVLCIVPLIMRLHVYDPGLAKYPWYTENNQEVDVFLYYRGVALMTAAVLMAVILAYMIYKEKKQEQTRNRLFTAKWMIPLGVFAILAFASTIMSENRSFGFSGILEQFESIWIVLSYGVVLIYVYYFVRTKEDIDVIEKGLAVLLLILGALGISQLVGHDFWETDLGKSLFVQAKYAASKDNLSFNFSQSGIHQVYLTLYNPNYVGVFAVLILPITLLLSVGHKEKKKKVLWAALTAVVFLCALGCGSKAFLIAVVATAVIGIIFYGRKKIKRLPIIIGVGLAFGVLLFGYMKYIDVDIIQYVKRAIVPQENNYAVKDFIIHQDCAELVYNDNSLFVRLEEQNGGIYFNVVDENGTMVSFNQDENNVVHFEDERFSDVTISIFGGYDEYIYVGEINAEGHKYAFARGNDGYVYMNSYYRVDEINRAEAAVFDKYDNLFSGRGYIWSRTIPLLKENLLLGSGADTFLLEFPQDDYIAKTNAGYQDMLVTKPHNMYLQMGVQYGVVALIAFLALGIMYMVQSVRICWKSSFDDVYSCLALGIFLGVMGYGIMGISNDSCVALTPLAWTMLGLGFSVNYMLKENKRKYN